MEENTKKAVALLQHTGENYFILEGEEFFPGEPETSIAYYGIEAEERQKFEDEVEGTEDPAIDVNFAVFCSNNCTQVEDYDPDNHDNDYLVLTDEEADKAAQDEIANSLWAFNADFILEQCERPSSGADSLRTMQEKACEGANDFIRALVDKCTDIETFSEAAISVEGRGHFLSRYDSNENEEEVDGETFFIYRQN